MRARPLSLVATAALTLLVLSACSQPGSAPSENDPQNGNTQPPEAGTLPAVRSPSADLMSDAARNAPRAGSVTQGSRSEAGTTADRVRWTGNGVRIQDFLLTEDVTGVLDPGSGLRYYADSGRNAVAAVVSRISDGSDGEPTPHFDPTDPVVFGPWMYRTAGGLVWGMFADGLAASAASGIPGVYHGTTIGVYTDAEGVVDFFTARVMLELVADGSLSGSIYQVADSNGPVQLPGGHPSIALNRAPATAGLQTGDTTFEIGGTAQPGVDGKWGAAFFEGGVATGTWGATDDTSFSVVGAFRATRTR